MYVLYTTYINNNDDVVVVVVGTPVSSYAKIQFRIETLDDVENKIERKPNATTAAAAAVQ